MIAELKDHFKFVLPALCLILFGTATVFSQKDVKEIEPVWYDNLERVSPEELYVPEHITKKPGHYTIAQWDTVIDNTWGPGDIKSQKIYVLTNMWDSVDQQFACFVNHPDYHAGWWDSIKTACLDEINGGDPTYGVSRGRFAAMLNYMSMALKETHTQFYDDTVNVLTALGPGVPLLVVGAYGENGHFGAGLTPLPDSSLLVFTTVENHPLGLEPGDIVLGYDRIPWKDLYPQLISYQLPLYFGPGCYWGSGARAYTHSWLKSAGMNWHLFDTLDVVKYSTGDTVHLSVEPLIGQNMQLWCNEQLPIPGVPFPDYLGGDRATFGIIDGTQIGYIYVTRWHDDVQQQFLNAVDSIMNEFQTTGLIIDFRGTYGGWDHLGNPGFDLLFHTKTPRFENVIRCSPSNHLSLCPSTIEYGNYIYGRANSCYDKPIAVLTGPNALSAADCNAMTMKLHPMARFFGKPTCGAFNTPFRYSPNNWNYGWAELNSHMAGDPGNYLTRYEMPIDEEVWLTPGDVALGFDTVVEAAKTWINSQQPTQPAVTLDSSAINVSLEFGETLDTSLTIQNNGTRNLFYTLTPQIDSIPSIGDHIELRNLPKIDYSDYKKISTDENGDNKAETGSNIPPTTTGHGGPDSYGYIWIDSDQPHGPSFNWVDISGIGTPVSLGDESYAGPIDIGFDFPFYENSYSQLFICSNGYLTFGSVYVKYINDPVPSVGAPNNFIAPWWDDLNPQAYGNVYYYYDAPEHRFIISFVGVAKWTTGGGAGSSTFEVILYESGKIELNYLQTSFINSLYIYTTTIGIENATGTDGLEIHYNAPYNIMDSLSILITTDWLAVSPYSGYLAPGDQLDATITLNAMFLSLGTYTGNIYLDSNDPVDSLIVIPVSLTVTGGCDFIVGDVNGPGSYNGLDITYGVNFFKYGSPTPQCPDCPLDDCNSWHYCGDVNASCNYNGLDITYGVNYFKFGSPAPLHCPDCPPVE